MELLKRKPIIDKRIRKSGFADSFFVIAVLFATVIFMLVLYTTWNEVKDPLNEGLLGVMPDDTSVNITETLDDVSSTTVLFDKLLPFLLLGLFGFIMIGASIYTSHPIMLFIGIIILAVTILLGVVYSNIYHQIAESPEFKPATDQFPISDKYMEYLPIVLFVMFIAIGAAILFARKGGGTGTL